MTIYMNVTDAVGDASHHGITRTERKLADAMVDRPDVEFVGAFHGRLWRIPKHAAAERMSVDPTPSTPVVERYGVDPPPHRHIDRATIGRLVRGVLRPAAVASAPLERERLNPTADDVLVSVGLDWTRGRRFMDEIERVVYGHGVKYVGFCYDLIPIDHPEWIFPADPRAFRLHLERVVRAAANVVSISQHTRRDLLRHFPELTPDRAGVLTLGADATLHAGIAERALAESMFDGEPYAIYCATLDRRKNHHVLYRAMRALARDGRPGNLLFVGMHGSGVDDLVDAMRHDATVAGRIAHVTDCDDAHLAAFYARAAFAVYPSLYEGWGLGVTEALAHGKPCLIASGSSLSEAGLGVCRQLHPLRSTDWATAIGDCFEAPPPAPTVELPTWADAADALLEIARR